jgi:predicted transposase YbfD/YdcC
MRLKPKITLVEHFIDINDPRVERSKRHNLVDIITIAICAVICGADTWEDIELFGDSKYKWFKEFLELPNGIPSHDTFSRLFARIDPQQFQNCFINWVKSINTLINGDIISIDGKALRHSFDNKNNIRNHWNIENQLHWTLDVAYREDDCRIRKDNAAQNFAIIRHISLNLLNQEKHLKKGVKRKRNLAGWDNEYLMEILTCINQL